MNNGYIYLWRKITESSFYTKPNCCHLAIHLLLKVNHSDRKMIFNNEEMIIKRGQVITGRKKLALETGLTEREIRTCLKILEKVEFLTIKATNKFSIIQVQKYDDYQKSDQHIDQQVTSKRPASDHKQVIISNDNKDIARKKNDNHPYKGIILYCSQKQGMELEFANYPKQLNAVKKMFDIGYKEEDIRLAIDNMSEDPYWIKNKFDMMNVANNIHKYLFKRKEKPKEETVEDIFNEIPREDWDAFAVKIGVIVPK